MRIANGWKVGSLQDRLLGVVLAMMVIVTLIAGPVSAKLPAVAPLALEGFAVLLLGTVLCGTKWDISSNSVKTGLKSGTGIAALSLFGISVLSSLASANRAVSLQGSLQIGVGVLLYFIVSNQLKRTQHLSRLSDGILLVSIVGAIYGCAQYGTHPDIQATGLFGDHQLYGSFLMILLPFIAVAAVTEKVLNRQLLAQIATVFTMIALLLAHSRSAWIGGASGLLAVGLLSVFLPGKRKNAPTDKRQFVVPGLMIAAGVGFFLLLSPVATSVLERANTLTSVTTQDAWLDRQNVWRGAARIVADHPLMGLGPSMYPYSHYTYTHLSVPISEMGVRPSLSDQTHNLYLQTAAELGLPGLVALCSLLLTLWVAGARRLKVMEHGLRRNMLLGALGATVAFAVDAFASPSWQIGQITMFFWLLAGIGHACAVEIPDADIRSKFRAASYVFPASLRKPALAMALLGLVALAPIAVNASRFTTYSAYNNVASIKLMVYPDQPGNNAAFTIVSTGIHPAGATVYSSPYPKYADVFQTTASANGHYKLQLYITLQTGDGGPITLDQNAHITPVVQGFVGGGQMHPAPYTFPTDNPTDADTKFNYGAYGDFVAYLDQPQDQGYKVTVNATYNSGSSVLARTSAILDFTGPGGITGRIGGSGGNDTVGVVLGGIAAAGAAADALTHHHVKTDHDRVEIASPTEDPAHPGTYKLSAKYFTKDSAKTGSTDVTADKSTRFSIVSGDGTVTNDNGDWEYHADEKSNNSTVTIQVTYSNSTGVHVATIDIDLKK